MTIESDGQFYAEYVGLLQSNYLFALRAEDRDGRKTGILSFYVNLASQEKLAAENLLMPPTAGLDETAVTQGAALKIKGYAAPLSALEIKIDDLPMGVSQADTEGYYNFSTTTAELKPGTHYLMVKQLTTALRSSDFSIPLAFKVSLLQIPKADFDNDNRVTITDWSIFLFRWAGANLELKSKIDLDSNGKVDIHDFSIFLRAVKI